MASRPSGIDTTLLKIERALSLTSMSPIEFRRNGINLVSKINGTLDGKIERL